MVKKSKITIENLAEMMQSGFKDSDKKSEDLARMVQGGFEEFRNEMHQGFSKVQDWHNLADGKFDVIAHELISIKRDLENVIH